MEVPRNRPLLDTMKCEVMECSAPRIYYCPAKMLNLCLSCYQDFHIHEEVIEIVDLNKATQLVDKIQIWLTSIREHGELYNMEKIYRDYFKDLKVFEDKTQYMKTELKKSEGKDIFLRYTKIRLRAHDTLKELDLSKVMNEYKTHFTHLQFRLKANREKYKIKENEENKQTDNHLLKAKEDMAREMKKKLEIDLQKEKEKMIKEFKEEFEQTVKSLGEEEFKLIKNKANVSNQDNASINPLNISIDNNASSQESFDKNEEIKNTDVRNSILEMKKNDMIKNMGEFKSNKVKIEAASSWISNSTQYLTNLYKNKTGRDAKCGEDFYMKIDFNTDPDKEVFTLAKAIKFKEMGKMHFTSIGNKEDKDLLEYLINNLPEKLKVFAFEANTLVGYGSENYYWEGVLKVLDDS